MNCGEFAAIVHDVARPGRLDAATSAAGRAHARFCPACAEHLAQAELAAKVLQVAAAECRLLQAPASVGRQLLLGVRLARYAGRRTGWWSLHKGAAFKCISASAALILVAAVLVMRAPRGQTVTTVSFPAPSASAPATVKPAASGMVVASQEAAAQEDANSDFVPVPYAGSLEPGDSAVVVRVQVPRSALAELGYPVDTTAAGDPVRADLLVGEDGWPYAVRIVH